MNEDIYSEYIEQVNNKTENAVVTDLIDEDFKMFKIMDYVSDEFEKQIKAHRASGGEIALALFPHETLFIFVDKLTDLVRYIPIKKLLKGDNTSIFYQEKVEKPYYIREGLKTIKKLGLYLLIVGCIIWAFPKIFIN